MKQLNVGFERVIHRVNVARKGTIGKIPTIITRHRGILMVTSGHILKPFFIKFDCTDHYNHHFFYRLLKSTLQFCISPIV